MEARRTNFHIVINRSGHISRVVTRKNFKLKKKQNKRLLNEIFNKKNWNHIQNCKVFSKVTRKKFLNKVLSYCSKLLISKCSLPHLGLPHAD